MGHVLCSLAQSTNVRLQKAIRGQEKDETPKGPGWGFKPSMRTALLRIPLNYGFHPPPPKKKRKPSFSELETIIKLPPNSFSRWKVGYSPVVRGFPSTSSIPIGQLLWISSILFVPIGQLLVDYPFRLFPWGHLGKSHQTAEAGKGMAGIGHPQCDRCGRWH